MQQQFKVSPAEVEQAVKEWVERQRAGIRAVVVAPYFVGMSAPMMVVTVEEQEPATIEPEAKVAEADKTTGKAEPVSITVSFGPSRPPTKTVLPYMKMPSSR